MTDAREPRQAEPADPAGPPGRHGGPRRPYRSARAPGRHRRLRRFALAGLPAALAIGGAVPVLVHRAGETRAAAMPSRVLCSGWRRCQTLGYDSYGYAAHQWRMYWRMYGGNNCTNYVAYVESTIYHVARPRYLLGDAGQWAGNAQAHGVVVNHIPSVGAVAVWDAGSFGIGGPGHVAVVEQVDPRGRYIVISQQNTNAVRDGYDWTLIRAGFPADVWQEWPSRFIHFPIPVRAGLGYYDPRTRTASLRYSQTAGPATRAVRFTIRGVTPLAGQWRSGAPYGVGFYNPRYGVFHLIAASRRHRNRVFAFGPPGMRPVIGDWAGAGHAGLGYYDPATGMFYLRAALRPGPANWVFRFGPGGRAARYLIPLAGNWTGGRRDGVGLYDPRTGVFEVRNRLTSGAPFRVFRFGPPRMIPVVGNWTGGRRDGIGYYDPRTGTFYLRSSLSGGRPQIVIRFGPPRMTPLAGDWYTA